MAALSSLHSPSRQAGLLTPTLLEHVNRRAFAVGRTPTATPQVTGAYVCTSVPQALSATIPVTGRRPDNGHAGRGTLGLRHR